MYYDKKQAFCHNYLCMATRVQEKLIPKYHTFMFLFLINNFTNIAESLKQCSMKQQK